MYFVFKKLHPFPIFVILFIISCSSDSNTEQPAISHSVLPEGSVAHPIPEKIPHSDAKAIELELSHDLSKFPNIFTIMAELLNDGIDSNDKTELSLLISDKDFFFVESLNSETLVILDELDDRLIQYDLSIGEYVNLAPQGRGPGDIAFTKSMQKLNDRVFVGMQGFRISIFNCSGKECEYESTINTEFNNYSLALENNRITVLGLPPFGLTENKESSETNHYAVHQINIDGEILNSFSPVYDYHDLLVRDRMSAYGSVQVFQDHELYTVIYNWLPYIFIYNSDTEFKYKYRIPGFKQGYYDYHEDKRLGRKRYEGDRSYITHTKKIDNDWLLITGWNRENFVFEKDGHKYDETYFYYGFHLEERKLYKIGVDSIASVEESRAIYPTEHGLLINEYGNLMWVPI